MDVEKVRDRIRKLLALATSPNEAEAALAASRAQELLHRYQLSLADVQVSEQVGHYYTIPVWWVGVRQPLADHLLAFIAGDSGCVYILTKSERVGVVGTPLNIEVCLLLVEYLFETLQGLAMGAWAEREFLLTDPVLGRHPALDESGAKAGWINGYLYGAIDRLLRRMTDARAAMLQDVAQGSGTELLVVNNVLLQQREAAIEFAERRGASPTTLRLNMTVDAQAVQAGQRAGNTLSLQPPKGRIGG